MKTVVVLFGLSGAALVCGVKAGWIVVMRTSDGTRAVKWCGPTVSIRPYWVAT